MKQNRKTVAPKRNNDRILATIQTLRQDKHNLEQAYAALKKDNAELMKKFAGLEVFVQDGAAYLRHSMREGTSSEVMLATLTHDFAGLENHDLCFLPRVSGYRELLP